MTNAMPVSLGICSKRRSKAWIPPAEAPIPTTGNAGEAEGVALAPESSAPGSEDVVVVMAGKGPGECRAGSGDRRWHRLLRVHRSTQARKQEPHRAIRFSNRPHHAHARQIVPRRTGVMASRLRGHA